MWFSTPKRETTVSDRVYAQCDTKDIALIKKVCPEVEVDGVKWWDTANAGLYHEILYLKMRGLIIIHPNHILVRFKE